MKIKTILTSTLMLTLTALQAQNNPSTTKASTIINQCDELKKENEFLKKSLNINEPIKTYVDNDIEIKLVSAKGNIKTQKITIEYLITNKIEIRNFRIDVNQEKFISVNGDQINISNGYNVFLTELYTDVPVKTKLELGPILPENTVIKFLTMKYIITKQDVQPNFYIQAPTGIAEFKDIPVIWK